MIRLRCPRCGLSEATTVCRLCKTEKLAPPVATTGDRYPGYFGEVQTADLDRVFTRAKP